jgi:acetyl esterase/lipase
MIAIAAITLFATAVALAAFAAFIVVPAPHLLLLPVGVTAPELSPWLALASGATVLASVLLGRRRRLARAAAVLATMALLLALTPLVRAPFAIARFDAAMTAALGPEPLRGAPPALVASLRQSPFVMADFVLGYRPDSTVAMKWGRESLPTIEARSEKRLPTPRIVIYRGPEAGLQPAIVQVFPGAWQRGAPEDDAIVARMLASRGYVVFAIDYRLAPAARWPAQIEDVRSALRWIEAHGAEHGADVTRMALLGRSSGAHLALLAAYADPPPGLRAVVAFYAPTDLAEGWRHPPSPDPLDVRRVLETFIGGPPDQYADAYRDASPITFVHAGALPTLQIHGGRDHIVEPRFGRMLDERLRAVGATSVYLEIPWAEHVFDVLPHGVSGQIALYYTERFLAWAMNPVTGRSFP